MSKTKTCYAYSLKTKRVKEVDFPYRGETLSSPNAVASFAKELQSSDIEKFIVLYLDCKNNLICIQVQPGSLDQTAVYPREVAKHALLSGASSVIFVHNHPSGSLSPSTADRELTRTLKDSLALLQIRVNDHVIISDTGHYSFAEEGVI